MLFKLEIRYKTFTLKLSECCFFPLGGTANISQGLPDLASDSKRKQQVLIQEEARAMINSP